MRVSTRNLVKMMQSVRRDTLEETCVVSTSALPWTGGGARTVLAGSVATILAVFLSTLLIMTSVIKNCGILTRVFFTSEFTF